MTGIAVLHVRPEGWSGPDLEDTFDVRVARGTRDAIAAVETHRPDCIVVEDRLDEGDGIDVLAALRDRAEALPIILCSETADGSLAAMATRHGVTEYVPRDGPHSVADRVRAVTDAPDTLEQSFEAIGGSIADAIVALDTDSTIVYANEGLTDLSGHDHADLVGESFERLIPPDLRDAHRTAMARYVETGERTLDWDYIELPLLRADGETVPVAVSFGEFTRDGRRFFTGVLRDITERREREEALERTNDALEALAELAANDDLSRTERIQRALAIGRERLDLPLGYLTRTEGQTQHIEVLDDPADLLAPDMSVPLSKTYCRETIRHEGLLSIADAERDGWSSDPAHEAFGISCYLGGTVVVDDEVYGTLCFASFDARERDFSDAEQRLVRLLVEWVGNEIERGQRREELQRYADIIEAVDDGVYALDDAGRFVLVNEAMSDLTGYSEAELLGSHTGRIKDDDTVDRAVGIVREMIDGQRDDEESFELTIQEADGGSFPAEDHMTILWDDDEFVGTAGVIRDITAQKERDDALQGLLGTTRSLMMAETPTEVAEIVVSAARETLGFEQNLIRLHDAESGTLDPVAAATDGTTTKADRPTRDDDGGFHGEAFSTGETVVVEDLLTDDAYDSGTAASAMYLPLGDHGTLTIASSERDAFDDTDRSMAEILASNAAAAFDRVEREQALLRYETVVENVNDMIYVLDETGRFQLVTQPLASYLGFDRAEMLGRQPGDVLDDDVVERFREEISALRADGDEAIEIETELVTASGERRPVEIEVSLIPGDAAFRGTVGVVRDLTELAETRERLHEERARFSYLFDALPDPVVETELVDGEAIVRSMNPAFAETFDLDPSAVTGRPVAGLLRSPDGRSDTDPLPSTAEGEPTQAELRRRTADGFRDFLFRGISYRRGDDRRFAFGIYTDITEQRERQRRLEVLNRVLRHNLRNDMTVVLGTAEELKGRLDDEADRALLDTLLDKAEEVVSLSDRAREVEGTVRRDAVDTAPVSAVDLVESVVDELAPQYPGATIRTDLDEVPPVADRRLRTAVYEVIENALAHNDAPTVDISVGSVDGRVEIRVSDDGGGIPDEELAVVTDDAEITQLTHGTGLGLWLLTWLTESYGGTVTFDVADGTTVRLQLSHLDSRA